MKLVITMHLPERLGGAEAMLLTFLAGMDRERLQPTVVMYRPGPFAREIAEQGVRVHTLRATRIRDVRRTLAHLARLSAVLRHERPDLVLNWLTGAQLYGAPAAVLAGLGPRNAWWQWDFPGGRDDRVATVLPGRHIAACSQAVADAQRRVWPHRRPRVIWPGIDAPPTLSPEEVLAAKRELDIPADRPVVGILGRLMPWKGQRELLLALSRLRRTGHDVHGLVVGGAPPEAPASYEPELRSLTRREGVEDAVCFAGQQAEGHRYIQLMDVFVNASAREPFGIVLLEAMAAGVPVVAVDAGGPREIVESGRSGLLSATNRPDDLAGAIGRLLNDRGFAARMAGAGRERYRRHFTARRMVAEMEEWILDAVGNGAAHRA